MYQEIKNQMLDANSTKELAIAYNKSRDAFAAGELTAIEACGLSLLSEMCLDEIEARLSQLN